MVPFESLDMVSYSHFIATTAISLLFSRFWHIQHQRMAWSWNLD